MDTKNNKQNELQENLTLDNSIMECFNDKDEMAVITGGKGVLDVLKEIIGIDIDIEVNVCNSCTNKCSDSSKGSGGVN